MQIIMGAILGLVAWFVLRMILMGVYTVDQNERAVKTRFGRAVRVPGAKTTLDDPIAEFLRPEEKARYNYPQVRVIPPGGPYFKMPWEKIHKVSIATMTVNMALDLEDPAANENGTRLEAVTKDQLNTGLTGQIRYRVSESQSLRLPLRHQEAVRARDGLLRFGAAPAHRQFRSQADRRSPRPRRTCRAVR